MNREASFGVWVEQRRKLLLLTRAALAQRVTCSAATIRKIEADERRPSRQIAELLAAALELPPPDQTNFVKVARGERTTTHLAALSLPASFSPQIVADAPPSSSTHLPHLASPLLGRETELASLAQRLQDAHCRLLTITGAGGMGKTHLAVELARQAQAGFADGVFFVNLAPLAASTWLAATIATAVGFVFSGPAKPEVQLTNYLTPRQVLLVLDNFEQLIDGAAWLSELLALTTAVKLLVTSREPLGLAEEWVFPLAGLAVLPPLDHSNRTVKLPPSAVELFIECAKRIDLGLQFTAADEAAVVRICQWVEGMPLAIKLAASWVRVLSCPEIAEQIAGNLNRLVTTARYLPDRHRSLRAVFDQSWQLLTVNERLGLSQLSVFRGGFTLVAAEKVAGVSLAMLSTLVAKSLVRHTNANRYDLHELVRQYAAAQLTETPAQETETRARHCAYFATLLSTQEARLLGPDQLAVVTALEADIANIRAAWAWAVSERQLLLMQPALETLHWLYELRMWLQEGESMFHEALTALEAEASEKGDPNLVGGLLVQAGIFASHCCHLAPARDRLQTGVVWLRTSANNPMLVTGLLYQGIVAYQLGELAQAQAYVAESLALASQRRLLWQMALSATWHGILAQAQGTPAVAKVWFQRALVGWRQNGNPHGLLFCLASFGVTLYALQELDEAEQTLREALTLGRTAQDPGDLGMVLNQLGLVALAHGAYTEAQSFFQESFALFHEGGSRWNMARVRNNLGQTLLALGDVDQADAFYRAALATALEVQARPVALQGLLGLATLCLRAEAWTDAVDILAYICQHSATDVETRRQAEQLRTDVATHLRPDQLATAEVNIQSRRLEDFLLH